MHPTPQAITMLYLREFLSKLPRTNYLSLKKRIFYTSRNAFFSKRCLYLLHPQSFDVEDGRVGECGGDNSTRYVLNKLLKTLVRQDLLPAVL